MIRPRKDNALSSASSANSFIWAILAFWSKRTRLILDKGVSPSLITQNKINEIIIKSHHSSISWHLTWKELPHKSYHLMNVINVKTFVPVYFRTKHLQIKGIGWFINFLYFGIIDDDLILEGNIISRSYHLNGSEHLSHYLSYFILYEIISQPVHCPQLRI